MAADNLFVSHLVDSADWVADHERNLCYVCTRPFGTFRRKHHCRMCGEVVCKNCTLYKDAHVDPTIGTARVRVCIVTSEASRVWLQNHLHSPAFGPSSEPDSEEMLRSLTPKARQHLELKEGHFSAEGESRSTKKSNLQTEQQSSESSSEWAHPWPCPPLSADEGDRLRALYALKILDSESEKPFDMVCDLAKARLSCTMAAVSFLDEHRQWFKASVGLAHKMIPRKIAFCAYTVYAREPMVILDTLQDDRFRKNPLVAGAAGVRFYAAAPIIDPNSGHAVGSVFVLDTRPRESCDISILERLALAAGENLTEIVASTEGVNQLKPEDITHRQCHHTSMAMTQLSMGTTAAGEQMEVLLMRLLTQNTETQQQLAVQQISLSTKLGQHTDQINKLMTDFARMEARVEAKVGSGGSK
ncbi:uncharacterized protein PITG_00489 [Phytophthora infestans T30-4]|uniref:FYVE-type domain-containing protein n=1 Tax=Phytophthora infestans (strain T30-4) TaxID=403677 RepID=D0MQY2_PHYIT|nr:uncharacterized protein PITG_00489 [Phytophthora infestans T30-4]EEY57901.1 conserved hypothetical protein [Phytophthora infestans T30-4]|eukprot:XP_002909087.1 conserved hypothetical protein [Phytophthora infestans T30-4]